MKSENEIRTKLDELHNFVDKVKNTDEQAAEQARCQIDMLLWLSGDRSWFAPIDERYFESQLYLHSGDKVKALPSPMDAQRKGDERNV